MICALFHGIHIALSFCLLLIHLQLPKRWYFTIFQTTGYMEVGCHCLFLGVIGDASGSLHPHLHSYFTIISFQQHADFRLDLANLFAEKRLNHNTKWEKRPWQYIFQDEFGWSGVAYDFIVIISTSHSPVKYDVQYCSCSRDGKTISWFISLLKKNDSALELQTRTSLFLVLQWVCSCSSNNTPFPIVPLHKE